jgi:hypothetical protein
MENTRNMILYGADKQPLQCYACGKRATSVVNLSANTASGTLANMQPACDEHNPYHFEISSRTVKP